MAASSCAPAQKKIKLPLESFLLKRFPVKGRCSPFLCWSQLPNWPHSMKCKCLHHLLLWFLHIIQLCVLWASKTKMTLLFTPKESVLQRAVKNVQWLMHPLHFPLWLKTSLWRDLAASEVQSVVTEKVNDTLTKVLDSMALCLSSHLSLTCPREKGVEALGQLYQHSSYLWWRS